MLTPERKVKDRVKKILKSAGAYYAMPATGGYGTSGVPDILVCYEGRFIGIECKANGNTPTALQMKNLNDIAIAGGIALVIDENNVEDLMDWIKHE
jgi:Holliday junction resolvase